jgi:hypothetical protein
MKTIQVTLQERWAASRHLVHKSKKTYTRKEKHNKKGPQQGPSSFFTYSTMYYLLQK